MMDTKGAHENYVRPLQKPGQADLPLQVAPSVDEPSSSSAHPVDPAKKTMTRDEKRAPEFTDQMGPNYSLDMMRCFVPELW